MTPAEITFIWVGGAASGALPFLLWLLIRRIIARAAQRDELHYWRARQKFIR